jgi:hypothetical protein
MPAKHNAAIESVLRRSRKELERMIDDLTDAQMKTLEQFRVYCLSRHPDSTLMWAHYADSFKGVCLEFIIENTLFCNALPITYFDSYPRFDVADEDFDESLKPLLDKSSVWGYEDEFRLIATEHPVAYTDAPTTRAGLLSLPRGALQSVIVGAAMPAEDREVVKRVVANSGWNVDVKVASLVPDRYEFEITGLD